MAGAKRTNMILSTLNRGIFWRKNYQKFYSSSFDLQRFYRKNNLGWGELVYENREKNSNYQMFCIGTFLRKRDWIWVHQPAVSEDNLHKILKLLFRFFFSEKLFSCENIQCSHPFHLLLLTENMIIKQSANLLKLDRQIFIIL